MLVVMQIPPNQTPLKFLKYCFLPLFNFSLSTHHNFYSNKFYCYNIILFYFVNCQSTSFPSEFDFSLIELSFHDNIALESNIEAASLSDLILLTTSRLPLNTISVLTQKAKNWEQIARGTHSSHKSHHQIIFYLYKGQTLLIICAFIFL